MHDDTTAVLVQSLTRLVDAAANQKASIVIGHASGQTNAQASGHAEAKAADSLLEKVRLCLDGCSFCLVEFVGSIDHRP